MHNQLAVDRQEIEQEINNELHDDCDIHNTRDHDLGDSKDRWLQEDLCDGIRAGVAKSLPLELCWSFVRLLIMLPNMR